MKFYIIVLSLFLVVVGHVRGQSNDTVAMTSYQVIDSVYGKLNNHIPSGYLLNRALMDTNALAYNTDKLKDSATTADYFYGLMAEYNRMALDSSSVPSLINIFDDVNSYMGEHEFNEDIYIYPIGIADFNFEYFDEETTLQNNWITKDGAQFTENSQTHLAYQTSESQMVAPLFDMYSSDIMGITFRRENFFSNRHSENEITQLIVEHEGTSNQLTFGEVYEFFPTDKAYQYFTFKVYFADGDSIINKSKIFTPELPLRKGQEKAGPSFPKCPKDEDKRGEFSDSQNNKIQFCFINSCSNSSAGYRPKKPYILVTGYRPPIFGQGYKKTWNLYSKNHGNMLYNLGLNDYDIILVRFNIHWKPYQHGMLESADLFIKFLQDLNYRKDISGGAYHENIIQGSSMGAGIVRLALLKMEKKHFENNDYDHHRSRLFLSYDANYYGANLPLAYQYQIYSGFLQPKLIEPLPLIVNFFKMFLFATMEQKTVKELLIYHAKAYNPLLFTTAQSALNVQPTHHQLRQNYYDELDYWNNNPYLDNSHHIFPLQSGTRNVAIALGKISGKNNDDPELSFKNAGDYWHNNNLLLWKRELRAGKYSSGYERLFRRKRISLFPLPHAVDHFVNVTQMQEVDNAAGSYLVDLGNLMAVTDWSHFALGAITNFKEFFSHKSTLTALGINPNLWPSDGSHTLDMQGLDLMFNTFDIVNDPQSDYFGYPNLGRPNNHFDVTPFEAIYVGENIHPHIKLEESDNADVDAINGFILNEVEPWYLGLQNDNLGAQARSNYTYKSFRRAKYTITTGHLVTPKTDPGDYNVEPNADLILQAGEEITLKAGTHIKAGAKVHLKILYNPCTINKNLTNTGNEKEGVTVAERSESVYSTHKNLQHIENEITIYPNPNSGDFTVASLQDVPIESLQVYNLSGNLVKSEEGISSARFKFKSQLERGTYFVIVRTRENNIYRKKIVVL